MCNLSYGVFCDPVSFPVDLYHSQRQNRRRSSIHWPYPHAEQSCCKFRQNMENNGDQGESVAVFDGYPNEKWSTSPLLVFGNTSLPGEPPNPRYLSGRARTLYLNGESAEFLVSNAGEGQLPLSTGFSLLEEEIVSSDGGTGTLFNSYIGPGELEKWRMVRLAGGNETAGGGLYRYEFSWIRNGTALVETKNSIERQERSYYTWANLGELAKKEISK